MFGLEDQKQNKKRAPFVFDLEKELGNSKFRQDIKAKIESRIQKLKEELRSGEEKERYDILSVLLQGYDALLKVITRVPAKP